MYQRRRKTHLAYGVEKTAHEAQYDENVKTILSDKQVLARIVKHRTEEFKNYEISEIMRCIEGEPEISKVPLYPGKRNLDAIIGMNTESKAANEGEITFDVRFYMITADKERIKIILNIEAQKTYYLKYHFESRAVFYCARMLSEQLDREFTTDNYDELKKVYSIWVFFEAPKRDCDTITEYYIDKKDVYGKSVKSWKYDYLSISFIRLSTGEKSNSKDRLINMLDTLFSNQLDASSKKEILEREHQMQMTQELEGGIENMCNVSLGIRESAMKNMLIQKIEKKLSKGQSPEVIAEALEEDIETILQLIEEIKQM